MAELFSATAYSRFNPTEAGVAKVKMKLMALHYRSGGNSAKICEFPIAIWDCESKAFCYWCHNGLYNIHK